MTKVPIVAVALINLATPTYSLLFVWKDNVSMKGLDHEQSLTECAWALPQNLIWLHRDDSAEGKDERMNVFHIEVVSGHSIRHRVVRESLKYSVHRV